MKRLLELFKNWRGGGNTDRAQVAKTQKPERKINKIGSNDLFKSDDDLGYC